MRKGQSLSIFSLLIVLEVLLINSYTTYTCSKKKKLKLGTLFLVGGATVVVSVLMLSILSGISNYSEGKGIFMLCTFLYLLPLKYLFDLSLKNMVIIMSSSWIYTMFIFAFSFRVGYLFSSEHFLFLVFLIQTFLYVITFAFYHKFINRIFVYILRNIDNKMINSLVVISFSWFFIIFLLNFTLSEGDSLVLAIFMLFVIIINAILSYQLVYKLVSVNNKAKELSQITQIDTLTQLKNREGFLKDVFPKIDNNECFTIIFMDLDNFKQVNDNFGHAVGDAYLVEFVKKVKASMNKEDGFYRLHGDEFVLLIDGWRVERICRRVEGMEFLITPEGVSFKGISYGYATFPEDGTTISDLMHLADFRMYQKKKVKHNK